MNLLRVIPLALFLGLTVSPVAVHSQSPPSKQDLFVNGAKYDITYPCYRQPAIVQASRDNTIILAFAEGRNLSLAECAPPLDTMRFTSSSSSSSPSPSNEIGGLVLRRSEDGGHTWSSPRTIHSGNIDFYTVTFDATTGQVWLMLQQLATVLVFVSSDGGNQWSAPAPLNATLPAPPIKVSAPAVGHGIQLDSSLCQGPCVEAGRLVVPFVCNNGSAHGDSGQCPACHACLLLSDDHGRSWRFAGLGQSGSRESQAVQVQSNSTSAHAALYVSERNFGPTPGHRMYARSEDGGETLGGYGIDPALPTPVTKHWTGIVAAVLRIPSTQTVGKSKDGKREDAVDALLYTAPDQPTLRGNLSARVSHDWGYTWSQPRAIYPGLSGYSDLVILPQSQGVGIIFENGDGTFCDRISFAVLPYNWLPA